MSLLPRMPFKTVTVLSKAMLFFSNVAYERWWEGRKIWGLLVNYNCAWTRQVITMIIPGLEADAVGRQRFCCHADDAGGHCLAKLLCSGRIFGLECRVPELNLGE
ncbi:hypothetical protein [Pontibacter brevis]